MSLAKFKSHLIFKWRAGIRHTSFLNYIKIHPTTPRYHTCAPPTHAKPPQIKDLKGVHCMDNPPGGGRRRLNMPRLLLPLTLLTSIRGWVRALYTIYTVCTLYIHSIHSIHYILHSTLYTLHDSNTLHSTFSTPYTRCTVDTFYNFNTLVEISKTLAELLVIGIKPNELK